MWGAQPHAVLISYPLSSLPSPLSHLTPLPPAPPHKVSPHVQVWGRAANVEKQALRFDPSGSEAGTLPDLSGKVTLNTTRGQLTLLSQDCVHAGSAVSLSTGKTVTVHCLIGFQKKPDVYSKTTGRKETFTFPYDVPYPKWSEALKKSVQTSSQNRSGWHYEAASRLKACIVATEQRGLLDKLDFHLDLNRCLEHTFSQVVWAQIVAKNDNHEASSFALANLKALMATSKENGPHHPEMLKLFCVLLAHKKLEDYSLFLIRPRHSPHPNPSAATPLLTTHYRLTTQSPLTHPS